MARKMDAVSFSDKTGCGGGPVNSADSGGHHLPPEDPPPPMVLRRGVTSRSTPSRARSERKSWCVREGGVDEGVCLEVEEVVILRAAASSLKSSALRYRPAVRVYVFEREGKRKTERVGLCVCVCVCECLGWCVCARMYMHSESLFTTYSNIHVTHRSRKHTHAHTHTHPHTHTHTHMHTQTQTQTPSRVHLKSRRPNAWGKRGKEISFFFFVPSSEDKRTVRSKRGALMSVVVAGAARCMMSFTFGRVCRLSARPNQSCMFPYR